MSTTHLNRRLFLQVNTASAAALSLGFLWPQDSMASNPTEVNAWIEINADEIGPSLRWATASIERNPRTEGGNGGGGNRGEEGEEMPVHVVSLDHVISRG